jgi:FkbM family methyltransferase
LNNVTPELVPMAVGDRNGEAEFWFPEKATWLGSLLPETRDATGAEYEMERIDVKIVTVDDFVTSSAVTPELIKIDTEGNEINVIKGADKTLRTARPLVIFEANALSNRSELWTALDDLQYATFDLPFDVDSPGTPLAKQRFIDSDQVNFISLPKEHDAMHGLK